MKQFIFLAAVVVTLFASGPAIGQNLSITDWYPIADSMTQYPPVDQQFSMASKKVDQFYITFVGIDKQPKVLVVAITTTPITDVSTVVNSLSVRFSGIKPQTGPVSTFAYVFDRNRDGKVDYLALLSGAGAYEGTEFPADFPEGKRPMSQSQRDYFVSHCKLIFEHWADDNFDGKFDAFVENDLDPKRDLVARQILGRSTKYGNSFDEVFGFRTDIRGEHVPILCAPKRVPFHSLTRVNDAVTPQTLQEKNAILSLINRAAKMLQMGEDNFYHPEETE